MVKKNLKDKIIVVNVVSSGLQIIMIGLAYLFLYKFLLKSLGIELLGVWSIVLSTSSLANLANFGVTDSVLRFVALYSKSDVGMMKKLIFTSSLFIFVLFTVLCLIIYPFVGLILNAIIPSKFILQGKSILPFSLLCFVVNAVNGIYASVLDGLQKNYIRNLIFSFSSLLLLFCTYKLVPIFGIKGVAYAQVIQSMFTLLICLFNVIRIVGYNPFYWNWDKVIFKQIFNYGVKFQFISLATMLNEPVTKLFLGKFAGMAFTGYYEMANRLVMQARGVIVNATQSLVPVMVNLPDNDTVTIKKFYKKIFSNVYFFSVAAMGVLIQSGHYVSLIWIGSFQGTFFFTLSLLCLSLLVNILNTPAYFFYMAKGNLNILIKVHLILGLSNLFLSLFFGYFFHGYGVIFGWFVAVLLASCYTIWIFNRSVHLMIIELFDQKEVVFTIFIGILIFINTIHLINLPLAVSDILFTGLTIIAIVIYFIKYKYRDIIAA